MRVAPWPRAARLLRFALTGGVAALIQLVILDVLMDERWPPVPADIVALLLSTQVNFVLSHLYTWRDRRPRQGTLRAIVHRWAAYQGSATGAALLNLGVFTVARADLPVVAASALGTIVASVVNFVASDRLVFRARDVVVLNRGGHNSREPASRAPVGMAPRYREDG